MPAIFSETILEQAIIEKFIAEDYEHICEDTRYQ